MRPAYLQLSDKRLALLLHKNDKQAFHVIFDRYWKRLYSYAYRIHGVEAVCEDCIQEIFITLWDKRKETFHSKS
ncbi:RNA polymerase sigma factor [Flavimarina sp. Hel_I_48]|uniref:RNA polymerase sigma factor n=1 Tax=Flavimarina sp. Hel_I_48 TaxID=1392488 RepID=UPI001F12C6F2|nr:sigma factor [Flavimarina sp. Hel_I_48]